eukprot:6189251-Pleurochrysis_carterae.AAC.1
MALGTKEKKLSCMDTNGIFVWKRGGEGMGGGEALCVSARACAGACALACVAAESGLRLAPADVRACCLNDGRAGVPPETAEATE